MLSSSLYVEQVKYLIVERDLRKKCTYTNETCSKKGDYRILLITIFLGEMCFEQLQ